MRNTASSLVILCTILLSAESPRTIAKPPLASSTKAPGFVVKPQLGLAIGFVRTVASETLVGEDRLDVPVELDYVGKNVWRCTRRNPTEREEQRNRREPA